MARGHQRRGAQCSCIGCIALRPALDVLRVSKQLCLLSCNPNPNAVTKRSVSVISNLRCAGSVCLCSMDFVSGTKVKINIINISSKAVRTEKRILFFCAEVKYNNKDWSSCFTNTSFWMYCNSTLKQFHWLFFNSITFRLNRKTSLCLEWYFFALEYSPWSIFNRLNRKGDCLLHCLTSNYSRLSKTSLWACRKADFFGRCVWERDEIASVWD